MSLNSLTAAEPVSCLHLQANKELQRSKGEFVSDRIKVTVKLFAAYQEVCGVSELTLHLPCDAIVSQVGDHLIEQYSELGRWRDVTRFGLNLRFVEPDTVLQDGDEVVLIPPVSGG